MKSYSEITMADVRRYLKSAGDHCPACKSNNIGRHSLTPESDIAWAPCVCYACGFKWQETFQLIGIADEDGDNGHWSLKWMRT